MILLNIELDNILGFSGFSMNLTYPKKVVRSFIEGEWLEGRPNFRYKKAVVLMGANATGKTSLGKAIQGIFALLSEMDGADLFAMVPVGEKARFSVDFVNVGYLLHRVTGEILSSRSDRNKRTSMVKLYYTAADITQKDSYETCALRLTKETPRVFDAQNLEELSMLLGKTNTVFSCPEVKPTASIQHLDASLVLRVLRAVIGTLDPTLKDISQSKDLRNSFIIRRNREEIIIQEGKLLNREALSSGTAEGVDIAFFMALLMGGENGFYYCDEHFSYIQSDIEKRIFGLMIDHLRPNEQLIFTTHNADMLDLNLPKHAFAFLRKRAEENYRVSVIFASEILKRNTDSVHCALENDMFDSIPDDSLLDALEKENGDE